MNSINDYIIYFDLFAVISFIAIDQTTKGIPKNRYAILLYKCLHALYTMRKTWGGGGNTLIINPRESKRSTKMLTTFAIKKWLVLYMVAAPIF